MIYHIEREREREREKGDFMAFDAVVETCSDEI
jgi:hypothetical protein